VPAFWRLHAVHHSDIEIDFSTTVRHHPGEAIVATLFIGVAGAVVGISPYEVGFYGGLANIVQLVGHANVRLPPRLEAAMGLILVTPTFHRIHHSALRSETDSNYGQILAIWDRLFASFGGIADAARGSVEFGLSVFRDPRSQRLDGLLLQPIRNRS
jgi:sterol desaturase/sphingolipid hydroxylase (fatty acid hydroxylase superfamily)